MNEEVSLNPEERRFFSLPLLAVCCILAASLLKFPGITFFYHKWNVHMFSTGTVTLLAAAFCCFVPDRFLPAMRSLPCFVRAAFAVFAAIGAWQVIRHAGHYLISDIGFCFLYAVLPLFGLMFRKELLRAIPVAFPVFWGLDLIACLIQRFVYKEPHFLGIPSNINWNAAFLFPTGAVFLFVIFRSRMPRAGKFAAAAAVALPSLWILYECRCRALILACAVAAVVYIGLRLDSCRARKIFRLSLLGGSVLFFAALGFFLKTETGRDIMQQSDRVYFVATVPSMIAARPLAGYGLPSFEQEYLNWRGAGFHNLPFTASRLDHPHNDLLFVGAGCGIAGLICWFAIFLPPVLLFVSGRVRIREPLALLLAFLFLILLIHAQLDLVFFHLPTAAIAMLFLGILWGSVREEEPGANPVPVRTAFRFVSGFLGAGLLLCTVFSVCAWLTGYHLIWLAEQRILSDPARRCPPEASEYLMRASRIPQMPPEGLFRILVRSMANREQDMPDPDVILSVADHLDRTAIPDYAHINLFRALALEKQNRLPEAETYMLREIEIYPLHVVPLMHLSRFYLAEGKPELFAEAQRCIREIMKKRGLDDRDMQIILKHPEYDQRPWDIPPEWRTPRAAKQKNQPKGSFHNVE